MRTFVKQHWYSLLICLIILLAAVLRFNQLGKVPAGMTWDEAAIGYNGYAIWHTRRDEWLERLPISFRSFGDYKAPLAIYVNGVSTFIFGMNVWAVRFPFAIASLLAILGMIMLVELLLGNKHYALVAGGMMALSPWHLHFSRTGFESGLALALLIWGVWALLRFLSFHTEKKVAGKSLALLLFSTLCLTLSLYTYHSAKIVAPLITILVLLLLWRRVKDTFWPVVAAGIIATGILLPLLLDSVYGQGAERIGATILDNYTGVGLLGVMISQWFQHLSPEFLVLGETTTLRHGPGAWGVLLPTTYGLILFSLVSWVGIIKNQRIQPLVKGIISKEKVLLLSLLWVVIGLLPAAIGEEVPHANRALLALPGFILLATIGLADLISWVRSLPINQRIIATHGEKDSVLRAVVGVLILAHSFFFFSYLQYYYHQFAQRSADAFKEGYLEALNVVIPHEEAVDKILFTADYGQPYIYALFARRTNPIWYRGGSLIKYEFTDQISNSDLQRPGTIVVASGLDDLDLDQADQVIYGSDGSVRFTIFMPDEITN